MRNRKECVAVEWARPCHEIATKGTAEVPLCPRHDAMFIEKMHAEWAKQAQLAAHAINRARGEEESFVYYMLRADGQIKIGFSCDPRMRKSQLEPFFGELEILATEPGGYQKEHRRHDQFAEHRTQGEWFLPAPELLDQIRRVADAVLVP